MDRDQRSWYEGLQEVTFWEVMYQVSRASNDTGSVEGGRCAIFSGFVAGQLSLHRHGVGGELRRVATHRLLIRNFI